jgi:8-oxo-dGTP pyrophosphatase MutT (NUDIX family)
MAFDLPRNVVFPVDRVDVRLDPSLHPFETGNRDAIAANWQAEVAAKPALFNGTVVLLSELAYRERSLAGLCHPISYAGFLYWRRQTARERARHVFAHAMLATSDNALIAIRMAGPTINAGKVYFAAGSFEVDDFPGQRVDLDLNMAREVGEETGLAIAALPREDGYQAFSGEVGTVIFRRYHLPLTADETVERIRAHVASEADPEIEGPVVIRTRDERPAGLVPYMTALIDWHFSN